MIIDGVVDGETWQRTGDYLVSADADRVMDTFFENCATAGETECEIWERTPHAVAQRVDRILADLKAEPIPIPYSLSGPTVITEDVVLGILFEELYTPLTGFSFMASILSAIEGRNTTFLSQQRYSGSTTDLPTWFQRTNAFQAISCSDFPPVNDSLTEDTALVRKATAISRWAGPFSLSRRRISCGAWKIRAKARYTGPVSAKLSTPVLVISSMFDPATPLTNARAVVSRFEGMRLLVQDSVGHSAYESLSACVADAMKAYMTNGTLPPVGTVCKPDLIPLVDSVNAAGTPGPPPK